MSILKTAKSICDGLNIPVMAGEYMPPTGEDAPLVYVVLTPILDELVMFADDVPHAEIQSVRIALFTKTNYTKTRKAIRDALLLAGVTITDMRFIELERDTGYYHYAIDAESIVKMEE